MSDDRPVKRRRRRQVTHTPADVSDPTADEAGTARAPRPLGSDGGLRGIVGAGSSRIGVSGALRGRDVNRPTDEDIAEAEREVEIVRRNWRPPGGS